jgi:uncharacterized protein YbjT (DUF2867 family)
MGDLMSDSKIIAVVGATGSQGGGLVRAILEDESGEFAARALTRDPHSDAARELADLGAEVVAADVSDVESLKAAFEGAYGAYCVTFFWNHFSAEKELEHARNMAQAARDTGLKHVIWSTLEDTRKWVPLDDDRMPTLHGRYKVPHFDGKGEADAVFREVGVPTTFLLTTFYWDNLINFGMAPSRGEDGRMGFALPMGDRKLAGIAADDIGRCAYGIFKAGDRYIGETVGIAGELLTGAEMASAMSDVLGEPVHYIAIPFDVYRGLGFPGADDLGNMFQFYHDFEDYFRESRSLDVSKALNPRLRTFRSWLHENAERIPRG